LTPAGDPSAFVEFLKEFLVPGSAWFLLIAGSVCAALLFGRPRLRRVGRAALTALLVMYWVIGVPLCARALQAAREFQTTPVSLPTTPIPIVVLGNGLIDYEALGGHVEVPLGQTAMNTLFGADRFHKYPDSLVIASGGVQPAALGERSEASVIADGLRRNGVPGDHIVLEPTSRTTHEQVIATARLLKQHDAPSCIVVTASQQMSRAVELFRREGIAAVALPAGSAMGSPGRAGRWWWILPSTAARDVSRDVIYELLASPYYRIRGWVR
jgi:uncharacterized SAM-binding protein YcdF (DUF218 family)